MFTSLIFQLFRFRLQQVHINFISFELEEESTCRYDSLSMHAGSSAKSRLLGKFCGSLLPENVTTSSRIVYIRFESDRILSKAGFQMKYFLSTSKYTSQWNKQFALQMYSFC